MSLGYKPSSIIGGPLDDTVIDQLSVRKEIVSKQAGRTDQDILFLNSNTGWVKMTSSVDVLSENGGYSNLPSKNRVLLGGTLANNKQQGGIFNDKDNAYSKSDTLGYRPMAGITNFQVDAKNNFGTLRIASVDFKVNSVEELDELEQLFLRPGFSVLLEWGHSLYYNNAGVFQNTIFPFPDTFFNSMKGQDIHDQITRIKEYSSGNYDGMYGIIKNFVWSFNLDGGYDCKVDIVSKGELIESLSMIISPTSNVNLDTSSPYFNESLNTTPLHAFLNTVKYAETRKYFTGPVEEEDLSTNSITDALEKNVPKLYKTLKTKVEEVGRSFHVMRAQLDGNIVNNSQQWTRYITLSTLMQLVNQIFTLKNEHGEIIKFHFGSKVNETPTSFLTFDGHFGLDPLICVLPKTSSSLLAETRALHYKISEQGTIPFSEDDLLNIYVNIDYILGCADQTIAAEDVKAKSVFDFLNSIITGIQSNLGDINEFQLHYEEFESTYYIVDKKLTPDEGVLRESFIDLIGLNSTLENLTFASKLSSSVTTMMAIAAQAGSTNVGTDMLAMQTWQRGLEDRHNRKKNVTTNSTYEKAEIPEEDIQRLGEFVKKLNGSNKYFIKYNTEDIQGLGPTFRLLMVRILEYYSKKQKTNPAGLIPFELSFTIKGIGGMKIGQAFRIDDTIIPKRYRGSIGFMITGVSHSIKSSRWVTDIKAQMIIIKKLDEEIPTYDIQKPLEQADDFVSEVAAISAGKGFRKPIVDLKVSNKGLQEIKKHEALRLNAYVDPGSGFNPITIGYGTTRIKGKPIQLGTTITQAQAEDYFKTDIVEFENHVKRYVRVDVTQEEFDALVSFTYNLGPGNLANSTLRKKINSKDYVAAADQFLVWNKAAGKVLPGLTKRRAAEKQMFLTNSPGNPA